VLKDWNNAPVLIERVKAALVAKLVILPPVCG
jgi:hypothetical protein